jgi:Family of unknown function (DUF6339)
MIKVELFTFSSCENLLMFKNNEELRRSYDNDNFQLDGIVKTNDAVLMNISDDNLFLGAKPGDDLESSMKIFLALRQLDLVQANDKRLWVTLCHTLFFDYIKKRWGIRNSTSNEVIKDRFHFEGAGLRARNQNSIARLWWSAKITYDETRSDPFELTKLLWEKQDFYQNLIDRKFSTYSETLRAFLNFYARNRELDQKADMRRLFKGVNAFGGVRILSLLDEKEVIHQIERLCNFYNIKVNAT